MKSESIKIRIDSDLKKKFKEYAEAEGKTMSQIVLDYVKWITEKPKV